MPQPTITTHMSYIQEKMNPVMEAMVTAVLLKCPEDPAEFMMQWLLEQDTYDRGEFGRPADDTELDRLRKEIESLRKYKVKLEETLKDPSEDNEETRLPGGDS
mmetsp:Transcript_67916/g.191439  ORF Transcript_67916/g.191439 Transcript_67916/m.191439 type:complete len:103 (-) Transcript_67916:249-557(-)